MSSDKKLDYGNWVSINVIKVFMSIFVGAFILSVLSFCRLSNLLPLQIRYIVRAILIIVALILFVELVYFYICRKLFSYDGEYKIQSKILDYVLLHLKFNKGRILDIGCGNGALAIKAAKKFPQSDIVGIDYWGTIWNFAKNQCEVNAELENVSERIIFQNGDAAKLDFSDECFDGAVSNFVFHEVKSQPDKQLLVKEALRVIKKGGMFAFHDLFFEEKFYGNIEKFIEELKKDGISEIYLECSAEEKFIPKILKTRSMLGRIGLIYGRK